MLSTLSPTPRPVVRLDYPLLSWQRLVAAVLALLGFLAVLGCGYWLGRGEDPAQARPAGVAALAPGAPGLRTTPEDPAGQLARLFASYAPAGASTVHGLHIADFELRQSGTEPARLGYVLSAQSDGTPHAGRLRFEVAGWRQGRIEILPAPGPEIAALEPGRLQLSFSRYVRTEGVLLLPRGFTPLLVGVALPAAGTGSTRRLACLC